MVLGGCLYYCKDTLFEAIHNRLLPSACPNCVVCITAKIHFLKQFTTYTPPAFGCFGCLYYCKDTLFEAIHNQYNNSFLLWDVVCITAKIHFLKQFTTLSPDRIYTDCCLYYCKDTLFEAIHNLLGKMSLTLSLFVLLQRYTF